MIVTGLSPSTAYHFRAVATNEFGQAVGSDRAFTTGAEPAAKAPRPKACKRGFVRRKGKCVKKSATTGTGRGDDEDSGERLSAQWGWSC